MKISLESFTSGYTIQGHSPGEIHVYGPATKDPSRLELEVHRRSVVVTPQRIIADWPPQGYEELMQAHFELLADLRPEVILLGSGPTLRLPSPSLLGALARLRVGYEVMDTAAACRTYNILAVEGRRVAAALLLA